MLRKSDIIAILDRMPDEFVVSDFLDAIDELTAPQLSEPQKQALVSAAQRVMREGGQSMNVIDERVAEWRSRLSSPTKL